MGVQLLCIIQTSQFVRLSRARNVDSFGGSVALRAAQRKGKAVDLSGLHGDGRLALSILSSLNPGKAQSHGRSCDPISRPFSGERPMLTLLNIYIPM